MGTIRNLLKAAAKLTLALEEHAVPQLTEMRMGICKECPNYDAKNQQCRVCGCFMDVKTTLATNRNPSAGGRVEITHCPQGRWGDRQVANIYRALDGKDLI